MFSLKFTACLIGFQDVRNEPPVLEYPFHKFRYGLKVISFSLG